MSKHLPVPPELAHLIEKRDSEEDRRRREQDGATDRRSDDLGPLGAIESAKDLGDVPSEERRSQQERRRQRKRRKADS